MINLRRAWGLIGGAALGAALFLATAARAADAVSAEAGAAPAVTAEAAANAVAVLRAQSARPGARTASARPTDPAVFEAWRTLRQSGPVGVAALKKALADLPATPADDEFEAVGLFRIGAANLLFQIAGLDEAETIAREWLAAGDARSLAPQLIYGTAYQAARQNDARVYPLLAALLDDTQTDVRMTRGSDLRFDWPDTHVLLWAAAGEAAEPALLAVLQDENASTNALAAATWVAAKSANVDAVPAIRKLAARDAFDAAKGAAVEALGIFGYPEDFARLRSELKAALALPADDDDRADRVMACVSALGQFGDLRAADDFLPLIKSHDRAIRRHARDLIVYLLTPEGLETVRAAVADLKGSERADADAGVAALFAAMGVPANEYDAADAAARAKTIGAFRAALQARYEPQASDPAEWTRTPLAELLTAVVEQGTTALDGAYAWVEPRHFLLQATATDRALFLAARQALAAAASDTVSADLDVFSALLTRLARADYRTPVGYGDHVEAK